MSFRNYFSAMGNLIEIVPRKLVSISVVTRSDARTEKRLGTTIIKLLLKADGVLVFLVVRFLE